MALIGPGRRAAKLLREWLTLPESDDRRPAQLRKAAEQLVELRSQMTTAEGETDWRGKSYAYRKAVGEILTEAGVRPENSVQVQNALRYHVGNILRERLSQEELQRIGLRTEGPRERNIAQRERRSSLLRTISEADAEELDALRALTSALALLRRVRVEQLAEMRVNSLRNVERVAADIERHAAVIRGAALGGLQS